LVSTEEHCQRLVACRLQADILNCPFIKGATRPVGESFAATVRAGRDGGDWDKAAGTMTFPELVRPQLKPAQQDEWDRALAEPEGIGLVGMMALATNLLGATPFFDWEAARTTEGYYRIQGSTDFCIMRAKAFSPYADLIWMETGKPILSQAQYFATEVLKTVPHQMLAYNLSPSFNWDAAGMTDGEMESFIWDLAKMGFCWQFITLAGFHSDALGVTRFARAYKERGMGAYVNMIQRPEREEKVETLTHQKWSGAELTDQAQSTVTAGTSSTGIMSAGVTEAQFTSKL